MTKDPLEKLMNEFTNEELKQIEQAIVQMRGASEEKKSEILDKLSEKQLEFIIAIMKERLNRLVKNSDKRKEE